MKRKQSKYRRILDRIKRFFRAEPDPPDDPYAYVGAPRKPKRPQRSAGATAEFDQ